MDIFSSRFNENHGLEYHLSDLSGLLMSISRMSVSGSGDGVPEQACCLISVVATVKLGHANPSVQGI